VFEPDVAVSTSEALAAIAKGQDLYRSVAADPTADVTVGIVGPGGCGKTAVLNAVRAAYADAGVRVLGAEALAEDVDSAVQAAVVIDDAHQLDPVLLKHAHDLVGLTGIRLFVAFRPWPHHPELDSLVAGLRRVRPLLVLEHLDRAGVDQRANAVLRRPTSAALIDRLLAQTGGHLMLVDLLLRAVRDSRQSGDPSELQVALDVIDQVRNVVDSIEQTPRALLLALAVGARPEGDVVSRMLNVDPGCVPDMVERARATGFIRSDGTLIPLIGEAILTATPAERIRELQLTLFHVEHERGGNVVDLARALARAGVGDVRVADALERAAGEQLDVDPESAVTLFEAAIAGGASSMRLSLHRARAAGLTGRFDMALQLVDQVLTDPTSPDIARAIDVSATVLAHRGLLGRAAELYEWLGTEGVGSGAPLAALALLGTGARDAAEEMLTVTGAEKAPTMLAGAQSLMAQGVWESVTGSATVALSTLSRATTLLEPTGRTALLPDTPAALTALVAIHIGELAIADSALRRAISQDLGGPTARARHHLLLAWIAMLRGLFTLARELIEQAQAVKAVAEPRDELFIHSLEVGLARRTSNVPGLVQAWTAAREAIVRHPVDLFVLLPLGELTVAAARLRDTARLSPHLEQAWDLLRRLGDPVLWGTPLHWYGVHAAILSGRPSDLEPHANALLRAAHTSHFAAVLATAGRAWRRILGGEIDPEAVHAAARGLQSVGLAWDGSRLLGQAAARSTDRKTIAALLQAARAMQEPDEGARRGPADAPPTQSASMATPVTLSSREREVAELLLQNRTYREIGGSLFISPKTVEHHVARMKQRLGVGGRSELFAQLRVIVGGLGSDRS
jgi:DNA-binding CsgD family transcriptional regulator